MKKILIILISIFSFTLVSFGQLASVSLPAPENSIVESNYASLNDTRAINEIRTHLSKDVQLAKVFNQYVDSGTVKAEITVNRDGTIKSVNIIDGLSVNHNQEIINSIQKIKYVSPLRINGKIVSKKIVLPIRFQ